MHSIETKQDKCDIAWPISKLIFISQYEDQRSSLSDSTNRSLSLQFRSPSSTMDLLLRLPPWISILGL